LKLIFDFVSRQLGPSFCHQIKSCKCAADIVKKRNTLRAKKTKPWFGFYLQICCILYPRLLCTHHLLLNPIASPVDVSGTSKLWFLATDPFDWVTHESQKCPQNQGNGYPMPRTVERNK
jgi:hypothetical protein